MKHRLPPQSEDGPAGKKLHTYMLLAIDTSTRNAGIALVNGEGHVLRLVQWRSQHNHSVELLPAIQAMLTAESTEVRHLAGIAVALGPGRFSALRVGISVAKGLAVAWALPLIAASTLECEAYPLRAAGLPVATLLDAGRGELAWALFNEVQGRFQQNAPEEIASPEQLLPRLPSPVLLCGEGLQDHADAITDTAASLSQDVRLATPYLSGLRISSLAHLGHARLVSGETQNPATLQPAYLRRPTITEPSHPT